MAENELPEPESVKLFEGMTGGDGGAISTYDVTIRVRRYNPEVSDEAYWDDFKMQMYRTDRVLDALHKIKWELDGPSRSGAPARTASAVRTQCALTGVTVWRARPC